MKKRKIKKEELKLAGFFAVIAAMVLAFVIPNEVPEARFAIPFGVAMFVSPSLLFFLSGLGFLSD